MKFFATVLLLCSASAMAAKKGLRGVNPNEPSPSNGIKSRKLMMGKGGNCSQQDMLLATPVQCLPGDAAVLSFRSCAWECRVLPATSPQQMTTLPADTTPQARSAATTPYQETQTTTFASAKKGGSKGGSLCQYDPVMHPMIPCAPGFAAVFNHRSCGWECKSMPTQMNDLPAFDPQPRSGTPYEAQPSSSSTKKGGSKGKGSLCQYDPIQHPMVPCPSGSAAVFNHRSCGWECKAMAAQGFQQPQAVATPQTRSAVQPVQPVQPVPQPAPVAKKGGSKLCQYDPIQHPMVPCPSGYASVFNHKDCNWECKAMASQGLQQHTVATPQTRSAVQPIPAAQPVGSLNNPQLRATATATATYQTKEQQPPAGNLNCPEGQQMMYDQQTAKFYCGN